MFNAKQHWNKIYTEKQPNQVSWNQPIPTMSLQFIEEFNIPRNASIIDIGGGDSKLVDFLLEFGYNNITVLDISEKAIERAKLRLGTKAFNVKWIITDINDFSPSEKYDYWHDRATFHFLTTEKEIEHYYSISTIALQKEGIMTIGTFSEKGPDKCSGLPVKKYNEDTLSNILDQGFSKLKCVEEIHITPHNNLQSFIFCNFKKKQLIH